MPKLGSSESGKSRQAYSAGIKVTQVVDDCMCIAYLLSGSDSTQVDNYTVIQNFSQTGLQDFLKLCCAC